MPERAREGGQWLVVHQLERRRDAFVGDRAERHSNRETLRQGGFLDENYEPIIDPERGLKTVEQGAATQEISRNVQQAAAGTHQVSSNIINVQHGASETGSASSQVLAAAQSLSGDSNRLKLEVGKFLGTVRAA